MSRFLLTFVVIGFFAQAQTANASGKTARQAQNALDIIAAKSGTAPSYEISDSTGYPTIVTGYLSRARAGTPVQIALDFLKENKGLFPISVENLKYRKGFPTALGRTVRFQQLSGEIPVAGAEVAVVVRRDGVVRAVSSSLTDIGEIDRTPTVDGLQAYAAATKKAPGPVLVVNAPEHRLVVLMNGGVPRLAWEVHMGAIPALLSNLWAYVDARSGEPFYYENRIAFDYMGRAFETNPGDYGGPYSEPIDVELGVPEGGYEYTGEIVPESACDYDAGAPDCDCLDQGCVWLSHQLYAARNCPDYHQMTPLDLSSMGFGTMDAHFCSEVQTAHLSETDDFFFPWEGDHAGLDDQNETDKFSEVQMFYHVDKIYNYFLNLMNDHPDSADIDWQGHDVQPLMATVNFRIPVQFTGGIPDFTNMQNPNGVLYPFDNAFYMPGGYSGIPGFERPFDTIVFGQGTMVDFSWDGDVIYHEFTHSVANYVSVGVGQYQEFGDEWGVNVEQGGMSEGYADAFPGFFTNEPRMGEYSLAFAGAVRDMEGENVCPNYLYGEVHYDSYAWAQSLYQARYAVSSLSDDAAHKFEQAAYVGLTSVVAKQGFAEAALATLQAVEDLLGADAREDAAAVFAAHKTDDCPRIMGESGSGEVSKPGVIAGPATVNGAAGAPFTPGIIQYLVTAADGDAVNLTMTVQASAAESMFGPAGTPEMKAIVSKDAPLKFSYEGGSVALENAYFGPFATDASGKFSLTNVEAGDYYVMPVNVGDGRADLHTLKVFAGDPVADVDGTFEYEAEEEDAGADTDTDTDSDTDTDTSTDDADSGPEEEEPASDDGCSCSTARRPTVSLIFMIVSAL